MQVKQLLRDLNLGSSVAEFDQDLKSYFVETQAFRDLVSGEKDVIAGDKGTGKTALFKVLKERAWEFPQLHDVEVVSAFNPTGNPVFQRLGTLPVLAEGQYTTVWKGYILSLLGNWLLEFVGDETTNEMQQLDVLLNKIGMRSSDDSASTVFSKLSNNLNRLLRPESIALGISFSESGMPIIAPKIDFASEAEAEDEPDAYIEHESALRLLNTCIEQLGLTAWVVLDRLDEAFQGYPNVEVPALRALLRTYLDLIEFDRIKLKLFVRKDLFRKVTHGGFVNLTHVNARRLDIVWDEEDLKSLLCNRIRRSKAFIDSIEAGEKSDEELYYTLFPQQVDVGSRKPTTWAWMMSRIRDGNGIKPPRNLIDLAKKAQENQLRAEDRQPNEYECGTSVVEPDSVRRALHRLSEDRVNDTLLAEAADYASLIEAFRDKKAEQNLNTISDLLSISVGEVKSKIKPLIEMGFLEEIGETYKVPMLYREGLGITQGKAFAPDAVSFDE